VAVEEREPIPAPEVLPWPGFAHHRGMRVLADLCSQLVDVGGSLTRKADEVDARLWCLPQAQNVALGAPRAEVQAPPVGLDDLQLPVVLVELPRLAQVWYS